MQLDFPLDVDFDDEEDTVTTVAAVRSEVTAPAPSPQLTAGARDLLATGEEWTWEQVRDYTRRMISETTQAHYSVDPMRETSIYKGFVRRHGGKLARRILVFAFETSSEPGWWKNAPITPTRLCAGADRYFALEIAAKLNASV